ncbi:DUF1158 domain-containing protein [Klebsiella pneumoniae]|uniref:DUF1158 domain-containing protein n=1 Tax=Klebsiella pneumoniae TaxID=573 RepID=UPI000F61DF69|nr:DUF1158 domain-containing protein [Klebsiella pneumoniae]
MQPATGSFARNLIYSTKPLLSCLLLPAPSLGLTLAQKLVETFHMMDLNQLYTVLFCLWFLALGAIEYLVLRWVWRRWFSLER